MKTLRAVPAVVVHLPPPRHIAPLNDYQWRQDESVRALLMALGLQEMPDVAAADDPRDMPV
jgi:hypothetical protein